MLFPISRVGILGNVLLSAFKLCAGIFGKSGAMVSDAVHSLPDVFATLIATVGVRLSQRQEDTEHPYGHERLESVASLILGLILAGTGLGIGYSGIRKIFFERAALETPTLLPLIAAAKFWTGVRNTWKLCCWPLGNNCRCRRLGLG